MFIFFIFTLFFTSYIGINFYFYEKKKNRKKEEKNERDPALLLKK